MAILQTIFAALIHSLGKVLTTVFGWATALLFGRVNEKQQLLMSIATFGSVIWLAAVIGIIFPAAGLFLLAAFVPPKVSEHQMLVRLVMLAAALLFPFVVGILLAWGNHKKETTWKEVLRQVLQGWPYTVGLAITLVLMIMFAPVLKMQLMLKRWSSQHMPVYIAADDYMAAVSDIESVLEKYGWQVRRKAASWMLAVPTRVLTFFAGNQLSGMVAENLTVLEGGSFEVLIHPSDIIISGSTQQIVKLRSLLVERLSFSHVYMTWDTSANELERQMKAIWQQVAAGSTAPQQIAAQLDEIERALSNMNVGYEEWEVLFREKLQIEDRLLDSFLKNNLRRAS